MFKLIYKILLIIGVFGIALFLCLSFLIQRDQHILSLYSTYKNNIDSCTLLATQQGKDEQFINENCIREINNSIIGKTLVKWGRKDLLAQEK